MNVFDPDMPPREEAAAAVRELHLTRPAAEDRRPAARVAIVLALVLGSILAIAAVAWVFSRSGGI